MGHGGSRRIDRVSGTGCPVFCYFPDPQNTGYYLADYRNYTAFHNNVQNYAIAALRHKWL
jgi:hypothetical protein